MQSKKNEILGLAVEVFSALLYCGLIFTSISFIVR